MSEFFVEDIFLICFFEQKGKSNKYSPLVYCLINLETSIKDHDKSTFIIFAVLIPDFFS